MQRPRKRELTKTIRLTYPEAVETNTSRTDSSDEVKGSSTRVASRKQPKRGAGAKPSRFDKLSNVLDLHAAELTGADAEREKDLRPKILHSVQTYSADGEAFGKLLYHYREVYKSGQQWMQVAKKIGIAINRSSRTVFRLIDRYERRDCKSIRTPKQKRDSSRRQADREIAARLAIRTFLENLPDDDKLPALLRALGQEAHQVWGERKAITVTIHPDESEFTIDGRLRSARSQQETKAA